MMHTPRWILPRPQKGQRVVTRAVSSLRQMYTLAPVDVAVGRTFARAMRQGKRFPLIHCARRDGDRYRFLVYDGNHRLYALRRLGVRRIPLVLYADIQEGDA